LTRDEAIALIQRSHPFHWKGCIRTFFDIPTREGSDQVFCAWNKKTGEIIFRVTETELEEAFEVLKNESN